MRQRAFNKLVWCQLRSVGIIHNRRSNRRVCQRDRRCIWSTWHWTRTTAWDHWNAA